jgi:N-acetylmuramoyl-L-alanine amidase
MPPIQCEGIQILKLANRHIGEKYVLGALAPKNNSRWKGPWDCAEFSSWLIFQVSSTLYGCDKSSGDPATADAFTGYWARDAKVKGERIPVEQAACIPGAAVLRIPQAGAIGHIVISNGKGGTIEAHSTKRGVIESTLADRRWDIGILVPGIVYKETSDSSVLNKPAFIIYRLKNPHMRGGTVKDIQRALNDAGFDCGGIDGDFGPQTQAAVVSFQLTCGLIADGEVGTITAKRLGVKLEAIP